MEAQQEEDSGILVRHRMSNWRSITSFSVKLYISLLPSYSPAVVDLHKSAIGAVCYMTARLA